MPSTTFWMSLNGALVAILVGAALLGPDGVVRHERLRAELERVQGMNKELTKDNHGLRDEARALTTNPSFIEAVIRDELGWVRSDELVFIFPQNEGSR